MKYWKQGFYDEPIEGSVEIEEEYYVELLDGQSSGKEIYESENGYPILVEHEYTIAEIKGLKVAKIEAYDKSDAVNSFRMNGIPMWLDKNTRVGLMNSINCEQNVGKTNTVLWYNITKFVIPVIDAIAMLNALELYALNSYNVTQSHIAAVKGLNTKEEIEVYDFMTGYPEKLQF